MFNANLTLAPVTVGGAALEVMQDYIYWAKIYNLASITSGGDRQEKLFVLNNFWKA